MRLSRTIFIAVLAVAVALLPTLGGTAAAVAMAAASTVDCCHDGAPCDDGPAVDDCASMSVCAVKCFSFVGVFDGAALRAPVASAVTILAVAAAVSQAIPPPLRPPRV